jgi:hypothetical protein
MPGITELHTAYKIVKALFYEHSNGTGAPPSEIKGFGSTTVNYGFLWKVKLSAHRH